MRDEIRKRVEKLGKKQSFDTNGQCLICGRTFKSDACPHSVRDQWVAIEAVYNEKLLS